MVNEFREYARVPEPELYQVDINRLVREVLALYQTADNPESESPLPPITTELAGELSPVKGDPARLRQVIHNLLQNAQDALANTNEAAITVQTRSVNNGIELCVTDNGKGFRNKSKHMYLNLTSRPKQGVPDSACPSSRKSWMSTVAL